MTNDPVLIAYTVKDRARDRKSVWRRIGVAFPHDKGAGLTVILNALPSDGRIVLVEPRADPAKVPHLRPPPPTPPALARDNAEDSS
jgi:hypothetical protein